MKKKQIRSAAQVTKNPATFGLTELMLTHGSKELHFVVKQNTKKKKKTTFSFQTKLATWGSKDLFISCLPKTNALCSETKCQKKKSFQLLLFFSILTKYQTSSFYHKCTNRHNLNQFLPVPLWGSKLGTKDIHDLGLELTLGESTLSKTNLPFYSVEMLLVNIINNFGDRKVLNESRQLPSNGPMQSY